MGIPGFFGQLVSDGGLGGCVLILAREFPLDMKVREDSIQKLPLDAFQAKRDEVIEEVLRAKVRHWDNVVTSFEDSHGEPCPPQANFKLVVVQ